MGHYVIVGGSSGIGLETAEQLKRHGHDVHVVSRKSDNLHAESGIAHSPCDVLEENPAFPDPGSPLSGLAYFPGSILLKPFDQLTADDFRRDFELNFLGAMKAIKAYHASLTNGAIVLMSTVAVTTGLRFHTSIAAAKGAIEGAVRSLAAEFAPNIRVNAVAPTIVDSTLSHHLIDTEEKRRKIAANHPLDQITQKDDVASLVCHLLSSHAKNITGQIFHIDGGLSTLRPL